MSPLRKRIAEGPAYGKKQGYKNMQQDPLSSQNDIEIKRI